MNYELAKKLKDMENGIGSTKTYDFLFKTKGMLKDGMLFDYINKQNKEDRSEMHRILRIVLTGKEKAPPNKLIVEIIGKEETIKRIQNVMDKLDEKYNFKQLYELKIQDVCQK